MNEQSAMTSVKQRIVYRGIVYQAPSIERHPRIVRTAVGQRVMKRIGILIKQGWHTHVEFSNADRGRIILNATCVRMDDGPLTRTKKQPKVVEQSQQQHNLMGTSNNE